MSLFSQLKSYIQQDKAVVMATVVRGPKEWLGIKALIPEDESATGPLLETSLGAQVLPEAQRLIQQSGTVSQCYTVESAEVEIFFEVYRPAPKLIMVGAVHIAADLIRLAQPLGFRTYAVDPRGAFATPARFPHVNMLLTQWPDDALPEIGLTPDTAIAVLSHDPKLDDPALQLALPSPAFYIGALGSRKTHTARVERLLAEGVTQTQLDRLHAPIGLNIGGRAPAEIALSIMAQIVAVRNGKTGI